MAKSTQQQKYMLSMAGEYGVCAELCKREIQASLTFGNAKAVDVLLPCPNNPGFYLTIEVKTSRSGKVVTNFFKKYYDPNTKHPDFWILVQIDKNNVSHYYILTHQEMGNVQMVRNGVAQWAQSNGCDNVLFKDVKQYEGAWSKLCQP
ncbi:MAG: hypothetical protein MJZ43_06465 [Bacteroidaceae bacterium]|nr:hypothetical protein [Bacteroidaceae bacterium]